MKRARVTLAIIACMVSTGCARTNDGEIVRRQDEIVASALEKVPLLRAFNKQFPESQHFISYITGKSGRTTWNSKAPLFGRYVLQMRIPASVDRDTFEVRLDAEPAFELKEVTSITVLPDGRQQVYYGEKVTFSAADCKRLEAAGGDFDALRIKLKKEQPVEGFSDYWKY